MNQDQFQSLRTQILSDIMPLVSETGASADSFDILLRVIQAGGANSDVYHKAYESAKMIQTKDDRLQAFLSLLDEMEFDVNQVTPPTATEEVAPPFDSNPGN